MNFIACPTGPESLAFSRKMSCVMNELAQLTAHGRNLRIDAFIRNAISEMFDGRLPALEVIGYLAKLNYYPNGRIDLTWAGRTIGTLRP